MQQPKRTKYRKMFKGTNTGLAHRGSSVSFVVLIAAWHSMQSFAPRLPCVRCENTLVTVSWTAASSGGWGLPIAAG